MTVSEKRPPRSSKITYSRDKQHGISSFDVNVQNIITPHRAAMRPHINKIRPDLYQNGMRGVAENMINGIGRKRIHGPKKFSKNSIR